MIAAAILGFIIGWLFSILAKNEKHQNQILAVKEKFDEQKADINQLETIVDTKNREIATLKKQYGVMQEGMIQTDMDDENGEDDYLLKSKVGDLEAENLVLLEQIREQKICDDEKEVLQAEIKVLKSKNQNLTDRVEELNEVKISYKDNIHKIAELESYKNRSITTPSEKKKKKKSKNKKLEKVKKSTGINSSICDDNKLISDKDLNQAGIKEDKLSEIIKNLFTEPKLNKE
jgi:hypothetical protein